MRTVFIISLFLALFPILSVPVKAQDKISSIDAYVQYGLDNNLVLKQKNITLEQALMALKMANGMFAPSVTLLGNYINGTGGRSIPFPVGDLLNPVYSTLNQLTASQNFPTIENVNTNFFPRDFYDVRARTSMPLFNTDLIFNRKIKEGQVRLQEMEVKIYQRELIRNIKIAYFNYLSARESLSIYESAMERANEGKRVNESLLANGRGLPAYILRSESEIEIIKGQLVDAERNAENAKMYLNFLLNREASSEIDTRFTPDLSDVMALLNRESNAQQREELIQLQNAMDINQQIMKMNKLFWSPRLSGFIDLGAQAENLEYNRNALYQLTGVQLEIPLFAGHTNKQKIKQSELEIKNSELNLSLIQQQLHMAANVSLNTLISSYQNYQTTLRQVDAARSYQRLIEKGYREGLNTFLEAIDARNQLTSAELLLRLNLYKVLIAEASLERETASYQLN